jgi:hypothetical protein
MTRKPPRNRRADQPPSGPGRPANAVGTTLAGYRTPNRQAGTVVRLG